MAEKRICTSCRGGGYIIQNEDYNHIVKDTCPRCGGSGIEGPTSDEEHKILLQKFYNDGFQAAIDNLERILEKMATQGLTDSFHIDEVMQRMRGFQSSQDTDSANETHSKTVSPAESDFQSHKACPDCGHCIECSDCNCKAIKAKAVDEYKKQVREIMMPLFSKRKELADNFMEWAKKHNASLDPINVIAWVLTEKRNELGL